MDHYQNLATSPFSQPAQQSPVFQQFDMLEKEIGGLAETISTLESRLQYVMGASKGCEPEDCRNSVPAPSNDSTLFNTVQRNRLAVGVQIRRLSEMMARIQL